MLNDQAAEACTRVHQLLFKNEMIADCMMNQEKTIENLAYVALSNSKGCTVG
jgi:hypothetical protein